MRLTSTRWWLMLVLVAGLAQATSDAAGPQSENGTQAAKDVPQRAADLARWACRLEPAAVPKIFSRPGLVLGEDCLTTALSAYDTEPKVWRTPIRRRPPQQLTRWSAITGFISRAHRNMNRR